MTVFCVTNIGHCEPCYQLKLPGASNVVFKVLHWVCSVKWLSNCFFSPTKLVFHSSGFSEGPLKCETDFSVQFEQMPFWWMGLLSQSIIILFGFHLHPHKVASGTLSSKHDWIICILIWLNTSDWVDSLGSLQVSTEIQESLRCEDTLVCPYPSISAMISGDVQNRVIYSCLVAVDELDEQECQDYNTTHMAPRAAWHSLQAAPAQLPGNCLSLFPIGEFGKART